MAPFLSVVIPTYNRAGLLYWNLSEMGRQDLVGDHFEVIVVNDGGDSVEGFDPSALPYNLKIYNKVNGGPASARNFGAKQANGAVLLFVGDDCIPHRGLFYRHWLRHRQGRGEFAIQGFTDWHPGIPPDSFHFWLNMGLQANWGALKTKDGKWLPGDQNIPGWFLTTNVSISRGLFERLGGFAEEFPSAAWEDVEFSVRHAEHNGNTYFEPDAVNYHYHRQTLDGFVRRQIVEGKSRLHLVARHPMMAPQMLDVNGLRDTNADMLSDAIAAARVLHYDDSPDVQEVRQSRWRRALNLASLEGIRQGLEARSKTCRVWGAIIHLHANDAVAQAVNCAASLEKGDSEFAMMCAEWAQRGEPDAWCIPAIKGEVLLAMGNRKDALALFMESANKSGGEKWPSQRVAEIGNGNSN